MTTILRILANYLSGFVIPLPIYYFIAILFAPFQFVRDIWSIFFTRPNVKSTPNTIYVSGVLGFGNAVPGPLSYWGVFDQSTIITPNTGPLSSGYDLAVELFYNLKGVNQPILPDTSTGWKFLTIGQILSKIMSVILKLFGLKPSPVTVTAPINENGHEKLHRNLLVNNMGMVPNWDEDHPLTFVGHSKGCGAVLRLMLLLDQNVFPGHKTSAKWIKSIVLISPVLPNITYAASAGLDEKNLTTRKGSKFYYLFLLAYYFSIILPKFLRDLFDIDILRFNFDGNGLDNFLHDNSLIGPEYGQIIQILETIKQTIKNNNIPLLTVVTNSDQHVSYKGKIYYLVKPVCNIALYVFQYFGDGWDGQKQDGVVAKNVQLNIVDDVNDKENVFDVNLDHLDVIGTFRRDQEVIDLWNRILRWIKNH
jgi:hypothetical protein